MATFLPMSFGEALKAARKRKRLTQKQLAQLLGMHYNTISAWELGTYLPETRGLVLELARHLELDEQGTRHLLEASLTAVSPRWNIPYQRNPFFTGREILLEQLHAAFQREGDDPLKHSCALIGLGGVGKTQTAIEYAYRYANEYSVISWVSAQTHESLVSSFVVLAELLNLPERREQDQNRIVAATFQWLNNHDQWLLIFDNVENIALVKRFIPTTMRGSLLFTSRRQALGVTAQVLYLEPMDSEEGIQFLLRRARLLDTSKTQESLPEEEKAIAQDIISAMGGLPLALDQAGSYIEATHCTLSDYFYLHQASQLDLLDERETHDDHPMSVVRTFTLIFKQLEQHNAQAAEMLTVCAFLAPEAIPESFFSAGAPYLGPTFEKLASEPIVFHSAIRALLMFSLLQRNNETHTVTIHRLVQAVLKGTLSKVTQRIWATRVVHTMSKLFPSSELTEADYWQNCERLLPHALVCIEFSEQWSDNDALSVTSLMNHVAAYLLERARYSEAEPLFQKVLRIGEQVLGSEHPHIMAEAFHGLAGLSARQSKYEQAEQLFQRALRIREHLLGADHPLVASSLNGLALLYYRQSKYEQAEQLFQRAIRIHEQFLGAEHPLIANSLNGLAVLYGDQGRYELSELLYLRALHIREKLLGAEHPQVATLLNNIAMDYYEQGKYEQAESLFQRALHIWQRELGSEHPRVAYPLLNLANLYRDQGKYEQAEPLFQRALHIWEQGMGSEHFLVADVLHGLSVLYREQGKLQLAEPLALRTLKIRQEVLGMQHLYVAVALTNLAALYTEQEKYQQAGPLFLQAAQIREQASSQQHPENADALYEQAYFYQRQQQLTRALPLYQQALSIYVQVLGSQHPKTKKTRHICIQLLHELKLTEEAIALEAQA
ncbi:tetratricopeptide repeat protein [Ktedonobacter sp. SOSP1-85]|uniref:helix-turn-helix domain-containing protein n=1 Tax=Ktedonobacter sp. SOSP1-85 TaxID=2778367 RepID=UPI0019161978|nr:helix-turn-helix domain-containing protein [Ktedonobacter sp. SOSP1-85]GHO80010.1 tetratricopeptide repeat protein [Ktedonobacter sp. SOSP1-85]